MDRLLFDYETRSDLDLTKVGTEKYLRTRNSDIVCLSMKLNNEPAKLWIPGMDVPYVLTQGIHTFAFNIQFDQRVHNVLGKKYGFPHLPLSQCTDVMALAGRYTFPQKLAFLGRVLQLNLVKQRRGAALMKKICVPPFKYTQDELREFYAYCLRDTTSMHEALWKLPATRLSPFERKVWEHTVRINRRGLPVDVRLARRILEVINFYFAKEQKKLPELTDGAVNTVGQRDKIIDWMCEQGCNVPNLQKETVADLLDSDLPAECREVLQIRADIGGAAVKKYKRVIPQVYKGRVYDNLRYYGAATGRWAGLGFQIHNLPRAKVEDIEAAIRAFYSGEILNGDVMFSAKALVRSIITAPHGKQLGVADFKSIENYIIAWLCGETRITALHFDGLDEYVDFAADLFKIPYDSVDGDQRFFGKVVVLGAGYNLGAKGLIKYADGYGLTLVLKEAQYAINTYRRTHPHIKDFWYRIKDTAIAAVQNPGRRYSFKRCTFYVKNDRTGRPWLVLTLPSGSNLYYCEPELREDRFGIVPTHMGINSYSHRWERLKLIPGRITENIVQSLARDLLAEAKFGLEAAGIPVLASIHDEVIVELGSNVTSLDQVFGIMCTLPEWAAGLPLRAEGEILERYKKI